MRSGVQRSLVKCTFVGEINKSFASAFFVILQQEHLQQEVDKSRMLHSHD
jgi:hypothetical protein